MTREDVPGITVDRTVPLIQDTILRKVEVSSQVVRYAFGCSLLAAWSEVQYDKLRAAASEPTAPPFVHSCAERRDEQAVRTTGGRAVARGACKWSARSPSAWTKHAGGAGK